MGSFYTNVTVVGAGADAAIARLRELGRRAFVADAGKDCVVYDRDCETQDTDLLAALADDLSSSLGALSVAALNHDDDVRWLQVYERGRLVAEYANRGGPRTRVREMCAALGRPGQALRVWLLLHRPFLFQVSRHARLARALALPEAAVGSGYEYVQRGELPPGVAAGQLHRV